MKFKFFKNKFMRKKNKKRLKEYEKGKILQVDNNLDNKKYFKELTNGQINKKE
jgi:hypothetical protein